MSRKDVQKRKKKKEKRKIEIEKKKKIVLNSLEVKKMQNPIKITINYEVKTLIDLSKTSLPLQQSAEHVSIFYRIS